MSIFIVKPKFYMYYYKKNELKERRRCALFKIIRPNMPVCVCMNASAQHLFYVS